MLWIELHFEIGSYTSYTINENDFSKVYYRDWWKEKIENEILNLSIELQKLLKEKNNFFFYDFKSISKEIELKSRILETFLTGSENKVIIFEDKGSYIPNDINKKYKLYLSQYEYINNKIYFINSNLSYNNDIKELPILQEFVFSDYLSKRDNTIKTSEIKELEKISYENITLSFYNKNEKLLEKIDETETLDTITKINKLKINENLFIDNNKISKIESIFQPDRFSTIKKYGFKIEMNNYILYYESIYRKNDLLFIYKKDENKSFSYNSNIGVFLDLFFYLKNNNNFKDISLPLYEILDKERKNKLLLFLN